MTRILLLGAVVCACLSAPVWANPYGFQCITNSIAGDAAIAEAQLTVAVTNPAAGQVLFTFANSGPAASSITDVYFDGEGLLGAASVSSGPGVSFSQGASPGDLPAGNSIFPKFDVTPGLLFDSDSPVQPNGVNPGESLGIAFALLDGKTFDDTIAALGDGSLRIGIHVQGFASGGSESLVHVPVPGAVLLGMLGLGAAGLKLRRMV